MYASCTCDAWRFRCFRHFISCAKLACKFFVPPHLFTKTLWRKFQIPLDAHTRVGGVAGDAPAEGGAAN